MEDMYAVSGETLTYIANAIRSKTGSDDFMTVASMPSAIERIPSADVGENRLIGVTMYDGYIGANGAINSPTGNAEKYSDFIEVADDEYAVFTNVKVPNRNTWVQTVQYRSDQSFISRDQINYDRQISESYTTKGYIMLRPETKFVRLTFRGFNDYEAFLSLINYMNI